MPVATQTLRFAPASALPIRPDRTNEAFQQDDDEKSLFSRDEHRQFSADDAEAGRRIAKILVALFIYPLIVMSIVTWWTFRMVGH